MATGRGGDPIPGVGDPIGDQFKIINGMVGGKSSPSPGGSSPTSALNINPTSSSVSTEPVTGNSLDQIMRSITNLLGGQGESTFGAGTNILGSGQQTFGTGLSTFQPSLDYWNAILSGDPAKVQQYIAPMAQQISDAYAGAKSAADTQLPIGGGRAATMANLPFQEASDVAKLYQGAQPAAANAISGIANQISSLALGQEGVGIGEQGQGLQQLLASLQALLQRRGQNVSESGNVLDMVGQLAGGVGEGVGGYLAGLQH